MTHFQTLEPRRFFSTYLQTNLVSNGTIAAQQTDANLQNPWGLAFKPGGPWWVANNGSATATVYNGSGVKQPQTISIPGAGGFTALPTGVVANNSSKFLISNGVASAPAEYIFVGEDGGISGWAAAVDADEAFLAVDNYLSANYKGATIATLKHKPVLYVADFRNGKVQMYDGDFNLMGRKGGAFKDPNLPAGYAPFNVQDIGGAIVVTYAQQDAFASGTVPGRRHGVVNIFSTNGILLRRMKRGNWMNSPWGVAIAPETFGDFAGHLLVSMFGSGRIAAFHPKNGHFKGYVNDNTGLPIHNDGIWAVAFGNNSQAGSANSLFVAAGPNHEVDGLFSKIEIET